jgi:hypothetical protein
MAPGIKGRVVAHAVERALLQRPLVRAHVTGAWPVAVAADAAAALNGNLDVDLKGALDGGGSALPYIKARCSRHIINLFPVA